MTERQATGDVWRMAAPGGSWTLVDGSWTLVGGSWTLVSGSWTVNGDKRTVGGDKRTVDGGRRTVDGGGRTVDGGGWTVDNASRAPSDQYEPLIDCCSGSSVRHSDVPKGRGHEGHEGTEIFYSSTG